MIPNEEGLSAWLMVALPLGLFATTFVGGRGYGWIADIVLGALGAYLGVTIVGWLAITGQIGWIAGLLATITGAIVLTTLARLAPRRLVA